MTDVKELIERLECATSPDRELDEAIAAAIVGATPQKQAGGRTSYYRGNMGVSIHPIHLYTASIDAALTLVPRGVYWRIGTANGLATCFVSEVAGHRVTSQRSINNPAIALTIASLKARAAAGEK